MVHPTKSMACRLAVCLTAAALPAFLLAGTQITEDFSTATGITPPAGWSNTNLVGGGTTSSTVFSFGPGRYVPVTSNPEEFAGNIAYFDSDLNSQDASAEDAVLVSPVFDTSTATNAVLFFSTAFDPISPARISVDAFNGAIWTEVFGTDSSTFGFFDYTNQPASIDVGAQIISTDILAATGNAPNAQVRFRWTGADDTMWLIDNVTINIIDANTPEVSISDAPAAMEGDSGTTTRTFNVTTNVPANGDISLAYTFEFGSASPGIDFDNTTGTIDIPNGTMGPVPIVITVNGDTTLEGPESINVRLVGISGDMNLVDDIGTTTIQNDEFVPDGIYFATSGSDLHAGEIFPAVEPINWGGPLPETTYAGTDFIPPNYEDLFLLSRDATPTLSTFNINTGVLSPIGTPVAEAGHTWEGLAWDSVTSILYGISTDGGSSILYEIDPLTGVATLWSRRRVNAFSGIQAGSLAFDEDGIAYFFDANTDELYSLDLAGAGIPTPVATWSSDALQLYQSLDWNDGSSVMYGVLTHDPGNTHLVRYAPPSGDMDFVEALPVPYETFSLIPEDENPPTAPGDVCATAVDASALALPINLNMDPTGRGNFAATPLDPGTGPDVDGRDNWVRLPALSDDALYLASTNLNQPLSVWKGSDCSNLVFVNAARIVNPPADVQNVRLVFPGDSTQQHWLFIESGSGQFVLSMDALPPPAQPIVFEEIRGDWCPPCAFTTLALFDIDKLLPDREFIGVGVHDFDSYELTPFLDNRVNQYYGTGPYSVPTTRADGLGEIVGSVGDINDNYLDLMDAFVTERLRLDTRGNLFDITVTGFPSVANPECRVDVTTAVGHPNPVNVICVMLEDGLSPTGQFSGASSLDFVTRGFLGVQSISLTSPGSDTTLNFSNIGILPHADPQALRFAVYLQDETTGEVVGSQALFNLPAGPSAAANWEAWQ